MTFVADLSKLMERGILEINSPPQQMQPSPSLDISIGGIYRIDGYRLDHGKDGWLTEVEDRRLFGETEYIGFTKDRVTLRPGYKLHIDPRSSFARLGLQAAEFETDELSRRIDLKQLPDYKGKLPLVLRTMRTNLVLPEDQSALQLLVAGERTIPLTSSQLLQACKNNQIEVLRDGQHVEPENGDFRLTFHPIIKRYWPSSRILFPDADTEKYFETIDMSGFAEGFDLLESCFYLGSTAETVRIGNKHLGMLTPFYPRMWRRLAYREVLSRWGFPIREVVEEEVEPAGYVHLTPWIKPGSDGTQTLEIAARVYSNNRVNIKPGTYACSLKVFDLDEECMPYGGRYREQSGPSVSRLHLH